MIFRWLGEKSISEIQFDPQSRDEIPKLLRGLQALYVDREIRAKLFEALSGLVPDNVDPDKGRKGMNLWNIFVLGTLRLNCNWDYDKLLEIANNHVRVRQMLRHGIADGDYRYKLQTLHDNVSLFTPEFADRINRIVVEFGHEIVGKKEDGKLRGSCDSYVVETDVHFPADIGILFDAIRVMIASIMKICENFGLSDWRQGQYHIRKAKKFYRRTQRLKRSASKNEEKKAERKRLIIDAHLEYIELARGYVDKVRETLVSIHSNDIIISLRIKKVEDAIAHCERQVDQIRRRVANGESIPHHEKVF